MRAPVDVCRRTSLLITTCAVLVALNSSAQTVLHRFYDPPRFPSGPLVSYGGLLYGMNGMGGGGDGGTLFTLDPANPTNLQNFASLDSRYDPSPLGGLVNSGGIFYGVGSAPAGADVFSFDPSTGPYPTLNWLASFPFSMTPCSGLVAVNSILYGLAESGGVVVVYKFDPVTKAITTIGYTQGERRNYYYSPLPNETLVAVGNVLWGTTPFNSNGTAPGTVFKVDVSAQTPAVVTVVTFNGTNGAIPHGLAFDGTNLYGTTESGGAQNKGTLYKIVPTTGVMTTLASFGTAADGSSSQPKAALLALNGKLYGTTTALGQNGWGTLFEFNPSTSTFTQVVPLSMLDAELALVAVGTSLWGVDILGYGSVFQYDLSTHAITVEAYNYGSYEGWFPSGPPIVVGNAVYGMNQHDGPYGQGCLFRIDLATGTTTIAAFGGPVDGAYPSGGFVYSGGYLYGTTQNGGVGNAGTVFKLDPASMTITTLAADLIGNGGPNGLVQVGSYFYGYGGGIFRVDPVTGAVTTVGTAPASAPIRLTTSGGLVWGSGGTTIWSFNLSTSAVQTLATGSHIGIESLVGSGSYIYGNAHQGGTYGRGEIFRFNPSTSVFESLASFSTTSLGPIYPTGAPLPVGSLFYGTTSSGGTYGQGAVFKFDPSTNAISTVFSCFRPTTGGYPIDGLSASGPYLYGMTAGGGGTVFSTNVPPTMTAGAAVSVTIGSPGAVKSIGTVSDTEDAAGTLKVMASVPSGLTVSNITNTNGAITATIAASCSAPAGANTVYFTVQDSALGFGYASLTVNVAANPAPTLGTYNNATINAGETGSVTPSAPPSDNGTMTLSASATSGYTGTLAVDTTTGIVTITNPNAGAYTITVRATDNCGSVTTKTFTLTVNSSFAAPQAFSATATSASSITLSWLAVQGATRYEVWRNTNLSAPYATTTTPGFIDGTVTANTAYLYKVRAAASSFISAFTPVDAATTIVFTDDPLSAGTIIKALHVAQLRTAVNALRVTAGLTPYTFTDASPAGIRIKAVHVAELRTALNAARSLIGLPALAYTDPTLTAGSTVVKSVHIQQLRNGVK